MLFNKKLMAFSLVASIFTTNVSALNIDEAVNIALKNNLELKQSSYDLQEAKENINLSTSSFLPKADLSYAYTNANKVNAGTKENGTLSAKLSYNLFNGFSDKLNKESSELLKNASEFTLKALEQDIILNTKKAYINYLDKQNALDTFNSAHTLFEQQYKDSKNRFEQGLLAKNDLLQVQVNMFSSKQNIVRAKADLKIALFELENILGGKKIEASKIEGLKNIKTSLNIFEENILENRSEIKALKMNINSLEKQKRANKGSFLPKVDASLSYNRFYDNLGLDEVDNGIKNQNIAGLNASWNIFNGNTNKTQDRIFLTKVLKIKAQLAKTRLDIKLQYENAKASLDVSNENFETSKLALMQAKENYSIVKNRFKEGVSSSTDLTDANYLLTSAKQNFSKAYFDKFLAKATINRILEK